MGRRNLGSVELTVNIWHFDGKRLVPPFRFPHDVFFLKQFKINSVLVRHIFKVCRCLKTFPGLKKEKLTTREDG